MALRPISQESYTGCFIACTAMLLGKTYREAFKLLRPGEDPDVTYSHGWREMSMEDTAHRLLRGLGFKTHTGKYKKFQTYKKRVDKHAIMIIRWDYAPDMCHCIMFDGEDKNFIEPSHGGIIKSKYSLRNLQRQLLCPIVIDEVPNLESPK
jgi:hypothetical protein